MFARNIDQNCRNIFALFYYYFLFTYLILNQGLKQVTKFFERLGKKEQYDLHCLYHLEPHAPRHICFFLFEKQCINMNFVSTLVHFSFLSGIKQLTFCTKNAFSTYDNENLQYILRNKGINFNNNLLQLEDPKANKQMKVSWMTKHSLTELIVPACKKLLKSSNILEVNDVSNELLRMGPALEPDFLVSINSGIHTDFSCLPPWILRSTELQCINPISYDFLDVSEFCALIHNYSSRQRRFGR